VFVFSLGVVLDFTVIFAGFEFVAASFMVGRRLLNESAPPEKTMVFESEELDIPVFLRNK